MERELLLLGLLRRQEMHGYQLHEFIDQFMQTCVDLKKSTAYYLLDKMAREGLVERSEDREGNRPVRTVYSLTQAGETRFQELLRANLASYLPVRFGGDVGVTFLDELPVAEGISLLQQRRAELVIALDHARQIPPHAGALQYIIDHQVAHLEAELTWLDTLVFRLGSQTNLGNQKI
ncbi:MAG: PadR family transcriptional regulator [Chloroflexota bacterium]|nr:PadR family transcriptional regulator [Anaerolineales bacterium]MCA9975795.1 PadR family transcriptional regulator [Anaerolineales bacterium]